MIAYWLFLLYIPGIVLTSGSGEIDKIEYLLLFVIYGLVIGLLLLGVKYLTNIPYTPMLLISGIIIGLFSENLWRFGESMKFVVGLSSHTLLFVFIPPLIFESSFNADVFVFMKSFWQILLLALPGVAILCVLIAVIMRYVLNYQDQLDWGESLTIGAIIAATDPVAVVSLLKELGTSIKFNVLLEGESLLNDGTATVFFWVFMEMVEKGEFDFGNFLIQFIRLSVGGCVIGLVLGVIFYNIMKYLIGYNNHVFIIMSIMVCYMTFYISESDFIKFKVSGILALVIIGLYFGSKMKGRLVGSLEESMHVVWRFLAYILETLLFLITGGYLGVFFASSDVSKRLDGSDIWKILLFQVLLLCSRGLILILLWPILNMLGGKKLYWKDILILTYAGLRGAIGLSLALFVATSTLKDTEEFKDFQILTVYYVAMTIAFTVLFNGLTIKYLIRGVNFVKYSCIYERMKIMVKERLVMASINKLEEIKKYEYLKQANWAQVDKIMRFSEETRNISKRVFLLQDREQKDNFHRLDLIIDSLEQLLAIKKMRLEDKFDLEAQDKEHRRKSFRKSSFGKFAMESNSKFDIVIPKELKEEMDNTPDLSEDKELKIMSLRSNNPIGSLRKSNLSESNDLRNDKQRLRITQFKKIISPLSRSNSVVLKVHLNRQEILREVRLRVYKMIIQGVLENYEHHLCLYATFKLTRNYIRLLMEELNEPISIFKIHNTRKHQFWLNLFWKLASMPIIGEHFQQKINNMLFRLYDFYSTILLVLKDIKEESHSNIVFSLMNQRKIILKEVDKEIEWFQEAMDQSFNTYQMSAVQTRKAINILINFQTNTINNYNLRGELSQKEYDEALEQIQGISYKVDKIELSSRYSTDKLTLLDKKLKFRFPLLFDLSSSQIQKIEQNIQEKRLKSEDMLYNIGGKADKVYLIISGLVSMSIKSRNNLKRHGQGEIVGLENVYEINNPNIVKAVMLNEGVVYEVPIEIFKETCDIHVELQNECKKETTFFYIKNASKSELIDKTDFFKKLRSLKSLCLHTILKNAIAHHFTNDQTFYTKNAIFVHSGKILCAYNDKTIGEVLIGEKDAATIGRKLIKALGDTYLLELDISDYLQSENPEKNITFNQSKQINQLQK